MSSSILNKISFGLAVSIIFMFVAWQVPKVVTSTDQLSAEEATIRVKNLYKGEIIEVKENPLHFEVTFKRDNGVYEASIDRKSGNFTEVKRVGWEKDNKGEEVIPKIKQLTEKEAATIALKNVNGVVDDIDLEHIDGVLYYLVEVEREGEADAIVQINAITGEVQSVIWDD